MSTEQYPEKLKKLTKEEKEEIFFEVFESAEYQALRGVVDSVFESPDKMRKYLARERYQNQPDLVTEREMEDRYRSFAYELSIKPRFGDNQEYIQRLKNEFSGLSSDEERIAFLKGVADFRGHSNLKRILTSIERAKTKGVKPDLEKTDNLIIRGYVLRSIFDSRVIGFNIINALNFARRYEDATGKRVIAGLKGDYERTLNEPDSDTRQVSFEIIEKLKDAGLKVETTNKEGGGVNYAVVEEEGIKKESAG